MHATEIILMQVAFSLVVYFGETQSSSPNCIQQEDVFCDHGIFIGVFNSETVVHCDYMCINVTICEFYTFVGNVNQCMLYKSCLDLISCANNCISGNCSKETDLNVTNTIKDIDHNSTHMPYLTNSSRSFYCHCWKTILIICAIFSVCTKNE